MLNSIKSALFCYCIHAQYICTECWSSGAVFNHQQQFIPLAPLQNVTEETRDRVFVWVGGWRTVESGVEAFQWEREQKCSTHLWAQPSSRWDGIWKWSDRLEKEKESCLVWSLLPDTCTHSKRCFEAARVARIQAENRGWLRESRNSWKRIEHERANILYDIAWLRRGTNKTHCEKLQHTAWWQTTTCTLHSLHRKTVIFHIFEIGKNQNLQKHFV